MVQEEGEVGIVPSMENSFHVLNSGSALFKVSEQVDSVLPQWPWTSEFWDRDSGKIENLMKGVGRIYGL